LAGLSANADGADAVTAPAATSAVRVNQALFLISTPFVATDTIRTNVAIRGFHGDSTGFPGVLVG
jgi:hypothetical protein